MKTLQNPTPIKEFVELIEPIQNTLKNVSNQMKWY